MTWKTVSMTFGAALALAGTFTGCAQQPSEVAATQIVDKTFSLTPETVPLRVSFLRGELGSLKVVQRVDKATGDVVEPPRLHGRLKLKNTAPDQAVRLLSGSITYADANGEPIGVAQHRNNPDFEFYGYQSERLDPGEEASRDIDVPFPAAALAAGKLGDLRLHLTYIPTPYRKESVAVSVSMAK